jgi:hypothetical protein
MFYQYNEHCLCPPLLETQHFGNWSHLLHQLKGSVRNSTPSGPSQRKPQTQGSSRCQEKIMDPVPLGPLAEPVINSEFLPVLRENKKSYFAGSLVRNSHEPWTSSAKRPNKIKFLTLTYHLVKETKPVSETLSLQESSNNGQCVNYQSKRCEHIIVRKFQTWLSTRLYIVTGKSIPFLYYPIIKCIAWRDER